MKNKILLGVSGVKGVKTIVFLFLSLLMILPLSSCYNKENREEILKVYNWADYIDEDCRSLPVTTKRTARRF